jgi:hypothetical protein
MSSQQHVNSSALCQLMAGQLRTGCVVFLHHRSPFCQPETEAPGDGRTPEERSWVPV